MTVSFFVPLTPIPPRRFKVSKNLGEAKRNR